MPPDEVVVEYYEQPRYWAFVRGRDFVAPRIASVILPVREYDVVIRETEVVNRTVVVSDRAAFAVNPGIEPRIVAAYTGRPLRTYDVRPVVLAGTAQIAGAVTLRAEELRRRDFRPQIRIQETRNIIRPADRLPEAQPLAAGERGRLGDTPPRAAQRTPAAPPTTGQAPTGQQPQPQQRGEQKQQQPQQGRQQEQGLQKGQQKQEMPAQQQGRTKQEDSR